MEIQWNDFENAAFSIFIVLLTRAILSFRLHFYIPISKVDENMKVAQKRDAVRKQRFYFKHQVYQETPTSSPRPAFEESPLTQYGSPPVHDGVQFKTPQPVRSSSQGVSLDETESSSSSKDSFSRMTIAQIMNGSSDDEVFPGLIPIVDSYLTSIDIDVESRTKLNTYLDFIRQRADGSNPTPARRIREFVAKHPEYKHDSKVPPPVVYDLMKIVASMEPTSDVASK